MKVTGKVIIMMKKFSIILSIILTNCIIKNTKEISQPKKIIEKNMIKYVEFTWKIDDMYIVNMTKETQKKILQRCNTQKITLIKINTSIDGLATGKFRCH